MQKLISAIAMVICLLFGVAQQGNAAVIPVYVDPTTSIQLSKENPQFTIKLTANPTTGYSWYIKKYNPAMISVSSHAYQPNSTTLIGSGGLETWNFVANSAAFVAPQLLEIEFIYARPWDINDNSHVLTVTIVTH